MMKGHIALAKITGISDRYIEEVAQDMAIWTISSRHRHKNSLLAKFFGSGWGVAVICGVVALGTLFGIVMAGRNAPPMPPIAGTSAESETSIQDIITQEETENVTTSPTEAEFESPAEAETPPPPDPDAYAYLFEADYLRYEMLDDGTACITGGSQISHMTELTIPSVLPNGKPVSEVKELFNFENLQHVIVSEGITRIGDRFLMLCETLQSISIPQSLDHVGSQIIPTTAPVWQSEENYQDGVYYIDKICVSADENLSGVVSIREGTTIIAKAAFHKNANITEVILPDSIKTIQDEAFMWCYGLSRINFPEGLRFIGEECFDDAALTEVVFPESLEQIGWLAFSDCRGLERVYLSSGIKSIEGFAFQNSPIKEMHIPSVEWWCNLEVTYATSSQDADFLKSAGGIYVDGELVTDLVIPKGIQSIRKDCFLDAKTLTSVTLSTGVKEIGDFAFGGCTNLQSITLPSSIQDISHWAFDDCTALTDIYYKGSRASWQQKKLYLIFEGMGVTVHCADDDRQ